MADKNRDHLLAAEIAYVQGWTCKHGKDDETPCAQCDAEDPAVPGAADEEG